MIISADKKTLCFELSDGSSWELPCVQSLPYTFIRSVRKRNMDDDKVLIEIFDEIIERYAPDLFDHIDAATYYMILDMWGKANNAVAENDGDASMGESSALSE